MRTLIVVDMQKDFIDGSLGTPEAKKIVDKVAHKIREYREKGARIIFTRDTHQTNYLGTMEGKHLPVEHCIEGTEGWQIDESLPREKEDTIINKSLFGFDGWKEILRKEDIEEGIELIGLCTDICVVSNALFMKTVFADAEIYVDSQCCAGVTPESHKAALSVMKMCQINVE